MGRRRQERVENHKPGALKTLSVSWELLGVHPGWVGVVGIAGERWGRVTVGASWGEVELHLKTVGSHCGGKQLWGLPAGSSLSPKGHQKASSFFLFQPLVCESLCRGMTNTCSSSL